MIVIVYLLAISKLTQSAYLLCDNDVTNKIVIQPNCTETTTKTTLERLNQPVEIAVLSQRNLSLNGFGYKCSAYYTKYESTNSSRLFEKSIVLLNLTELECKIMALIHTYTTESGRKFTLACNTHSTKCIFKDEREPIANGSSVQKRYSLSVTRVELKSNSRGQIVHKNDVLEECRIEEKACNLDGSLYVWDTNIIQTEGFTLVDHGTYYIDDELMHSSNSSMLFFLAGEFTDNQTGTQYLTTSCGFYVLAKADKNRDLFDRVIDESRLRRLGVDLSPIEIEKINEARQAYRLVRLLNETGNKRREEENNRTCALYINQLNLMSSLPNNYYLFRLFNGTQVYLYVYNGKILVTKCEPLLSVNEAFVETKECFKYRPVAVYDQRFNRIQGYLFNQFFINRYPEKIPCSLKTV